MSSLLDALCCIFCTPCYVFRKSLSERGEYVVIEDLPQEESVSMQTKRTERSPLLRDEHEGLSKVEKTWLTSDLRSSSREIEKQIENQLTKLEAIEKKLASKDDVDPKIPLSPEPDNSLWLEEEEEEEEDVETNFFFPKSEENEAESEESVTDEKHEPPPPRFLKEHSIEQQEELIFDLPYRLILEIFEFYEYEIFPKVTISSNKTKSSFSLFGYFTKDRIRRKIFFLFKSLRIEKWTSLIMNITKIRNLSVIDGRQSFFSFLAKNSENFLSLHTLKILGKQFIKGNVVMYNFSDVSIGSLFSSKEDLKCFPALKKLTIHIEDNMKNISNDFSSWCHKSNSSLWDNLESLSIRFTSEDDDRIIIPLPESNFLNSSKFTSLKELTLSRLSFSIPDDNNKENNDSLYLPSLNLLEIENCNDLGFSIRSDKEKLSNVTFFKYSPSSEWKEILYGLKNLKKIYFMESSGTGNSDLCWFFRTYRNEISNLEEFFCRGYTLCDNNNNNNNSYENKFLPSSLKRLTIQECSKLDTELLFPDDGDYNLEYFSLSQCSITSTKLNLPFTDRLEEIIFCAMEEDNLDDDFFKNNSFKSLKKLTLYADPKLTGNFEVLGGHGIETLNIVQNEELNDTLFQKNCFRSLQRLLISGSSKIKGRQWRKDFSRCVKYMHIGDVSITDQFFQDNQFLVLEELIIHSVLGEGIKGEGWAGIPNLQHLEIFNNNTIGDLLFQKNTFQKLRILEIKYSGNFLGVEWRYLPSLDHLYIFAEVTNGQANNDEVFGKWFWGEGNQPFPLRIKRDESLATIIVNENTRMFGNE